MNMTTVYSMTLIDSQFDRRSVF